MTIILTWGAGISCNYSFNMLKMWTFLILEFLSKYSPGIAKSEHRGKGPMDLLSGRSLGCKSLFKPWSICPPANTHPLLRKRKKGIWKGTEFTKFTQKGIVTTSDSEATEVCICLLSGKIQLDVSRQPSVSTGAALVLIAAHWHRLNSADREPSTPKTCPTTSIPQVGVGEKHLCGPSRLSSHLQRKRMKLRGWAQPPGHWAQEQWRGSRQQEQWEVTPQRQQQLWRYGPRHKPHGQAFKTFSSRHHPSNSRLLVGECLFLQLLPHLLPQPFGFYSI